MPREEALPETEGKPATQNLPEAIPKIAMEIARLDPGPAAALRRGPRNGAGAAAFWRLLAKYSPVEGKRNESGWGALIQAIAILTPKGRDPAKRSAHNQSLPMGQVFYSARISDLRLARLLAASPDLRSELAVRICRRLATTEFNQFNLVTLGYFILYGDDSTDRRIARDYYRADAAARRRSQDTETPTDA